MDLAADLALAVELADAAGALALRRFRAPDLEVETKPDGSAVTDADRAAERVLRDRLAHDRPSDAILGEEEGGPTEPGGRRWLLDPIDGTSHFVAGRPLWTAFVALEVDGVVVAGAVAQPALDHRWHAARGLGAVRDDTPLRVSSAASLAAATVHDDWRDTLARAGRTTVTGCADPAVGSLPAEDRPLVALADAAGRVEPGPADGFLAVAAGEADVCAGHGGEAWDHATISVIVEEAGGRFTDWDGRAAVDSRHALVTNRRLHDAALDVVRAVRSR